MSGRLRHVLIFLLMILKEAELPEAGAGCECSSSSPCYRRPSWRKTRTPCCKCIGLSLTSVPHDLPISTSFLYLALNQLTSFPQNLPKAIAYLYIENNQITSIQQGTFSNLPQLRLLQLYNNGITKIDPGIFSDHHELSYVHLRSNKITELQTDSFSNLPKLQSLDLAKNRITAIQPGAFTNLPNFANLDLQSNQLSVLPMYVHGIFANIRKVLLQYNHWRCDCRMIPFRRKMSGSASFENLMTCAQPAKFRKQKLKDISPRGLICKETTISTLPFDHGVHSLFTSTSMPTSSSIGNKEGNTNPTPDHVDSTYATLSVDIRTTFSPPVKSPSSLSSNTKINIISTTATQPLPSQFEGTNNDSNATAISYHYWYFKTNAGSTAHPVDITTEPLSKPLAITSYGSHKSPPSFPLPALIGSICGSIAAIVFIGSIVVAIWRKRRMGHLVIAKANSNATVVTSGHDQTGQDQVSG